MANLTKHPDFYNIDFTFDGEVWRPVYKFEKRFKISNYGRLISINGRWKGERMLKPVIGDKGYFQTSLRNIKTNWAVRIHTLVGLEFIPIPLDLKISGEKITINHDDGDKLNNYYKNLEWMTQGDNIYHALENGLIDNRGARSARSKLTEEEVLLIRKLASEGMVHQKIADQIGKIDRRHLTDIVNRKCWKHI